MIPLDYSCKFLMGQSASAAIMERVRPVEGGGPQPAPHSNTHTHVSPDALVFALALPYLQQRGHQKQSPARSPAVVIRGPAPFSGGTQVRDEQEHEQQPRPHRAETEFCYLHCSFLISL